MKLNALIQKHRDLKSKKGVRICGAWYEIIFPERNQIVVQPGCTFNLSIPKKHSLHCPLILNFSRVTGYSKSGIELRAKLMQHVILTNDDEGPWRVSRRQNKPLKIGQASGSFGFLAIAGLGRSPKQLFTEGCDLKALTDEDLAKLYECVAELTASGKPPRLGLLCYDVQP